MGNNKPNKKSPETEPQNEKTNGAFYGNSQGAANINREPPDGPANDDYEREEPPPGKVWVYSPYIVRYGRRIFRKDGKMWRFPGDPDYQRS